MKNSRSEAAIRVFKFGGNSVCDPESVGNMVRVLEHSKDEELLIVVSAMGKTTNELERLVQDQKEGGEPQKTLEKVRSYHEELTKGLFHDPEAQVNDKIDKLFRELEGIIGYANDEMPYDEAYDRVVPYGELLSATIISEYLETVGHPNRWYDARELIATDSTHRRAHPDHGRTGDQVKERLAPFFQEGAKGKRAITQGFIGHSGTAPTTLGREGSDHTAAILAYHLDAEDLTIWKDVPGILNADPRYFQEPRKLDRISYREAIELSYYGAKVLHPRTVQPLQQKDIPLYVKSFLEPTSPGTCIGEGFEEAPPIPCYILKKEQVLVSLIPPDLSFVLETDLSHIFDVLAQKGCSVNMMENSAIHFSVSIDSNGQLPALLEALEKDYEVRYNTGLELLTIRHYDEEDLTEKVRGRNIYLEQRTRHMARFLMGPEKR